MASPTGLATRSPGCAVTGRACSNSTGPRGGSRGRAARSATVGPPPRPSNTSKPCQRTSPGTPIPTGCVIAYSSYDQTGDQPPAPNALFGRNTAPDHQVLCVNPATLLNATAPDTAQPLDAYLPTSQLVAGNVLNPNRNLAIVLLGFTLPNYPTGFAHYPDTLTGQCQFRQDSAGNASWLQITGGDTLFPASSHTSALGLHVVDYNVALGALVQLAAQQAQTWLAARR